MIQYFEGIAIFLIIAGIWSLLYLIGIKRIKGLSKGTFRISGLLSMLFLIMVIGIAIFAVGAFLDYHHNPKFCGTTCHPMEPYYASYIDPLNNQVMRTHVENEITCLDCHTGPGLTGQIDPFFNAPHELYSFVTGDYDPDNLHGYVPVKNCLKGCHEHLDWMIEAPEGRGSNFTVVNGSTVWPTRQIWHPYTSNGTDMSPLLERETCVDCHDQRMNGVGYTRDACPLCHDISVDELNLHRDQTCGMENCHTQPEFVGHREVMDNCMFCHDRQHPEDARVPYVIATEHGIYNFNSTFCSTCHVENYVIFTQSESKHGSETGCPDCHEEHQQHPLCMSCHEVFGVNHTITTPYDDCQECHILSGHDPLSIPFANPLFTQEFCNECHSTQYSTFTQSQNKHSENFNCTDCHSEHKEKPTCTNCHDSSNTDHPVSEPYDDCISCHPSGAHSPSITQGVHSSFNCDNCHGDFPSMGVQFNVCSACHVTGIPDWHNESTQDCITCHDTSTIHTNLILPP